MIYFMAGDYTTNASLTDVTINAGIQDYTTTQILMVEGLNDVLLIPGEVNFTGYCRAYIAVFSGELEFSTDKITGVGENRKFAFNSGIQDIKNREWNMDLIEII
jgi:hypothetical protein